MMQLGGQKTLDAGAVLSMVVGAIVISTSAPWVKVAEVAPTVSAFYRMAIGALGLIVLCLIQRRALWLGWRYAFRFLPVAILFALDLFFWHRSIVYIGPGLATLLGNFQVFVLTVVGWLIYRERVGLKFLIGALGAFAGIWILVGVDWSGLDPTYRYGVLFGLATAVAYSAFILTMRAAQSAEIALSPPANLALMSVFCAVLLGLLAQAEGHGFAVPNARTWWVLIAYGLLCQVVGWMLITRAMPRIPAAFIGLFLLLQPALSFLWDILFFARPTDGYDLLGALLVLGGIYIAHRRGTDS